MDPEKIAFLHSIHLPFPQSAYVKACWEHCPTRNRVGHYTPYSVVGNDMTTGMIAWFFISLFIALVSGSTTVGILAFGCIWQGFSALFSLILLSRLFAVEHVMSMPNWLDWQPADAEITGRGVIRRLKKRSIALAIGHYGVWSIVSIAAYIATAHHTGALTCFAIGTLSMVAHGLTVYLIQRQVTARARVYAGHHYTPEPAAPLTAPNPGHPRPVLE